MKMETAEHRLARPVGLSRSPAGAGFLDRLLFRALGRRRRLLVNFRYQMKAAVIGVTGMGFLVGLMILLLHRSNTRNSRELLEIAPFLRDSLTARDRDQILMLTAGGLIFTAGVFLMKILESHRTAGVILNVRRRLEELRAGDLDARVTLRKHDNFSELAGTFNDLATALRARAEGDAATLGRLAAQASDLLREEARGNQQGTRQIAEALRQSLEDTRRRKAELLEP